MPGRSQADDQGLSSDGNRSVMSGSPATAKPAVIFVGAFAPAERDGAVGGQLYACRSLVDSALSDHLDWILLDTTQKSLPPPSLPERLWFALARIIRLLRTLKPSVHALLVFSGCALLSLAEKGLMCWFGRLAGKHAVLSLRSEVKVPTNPVLRSLTRFLLRGAHVLVCQSEAAAAAARRLVGTSAPEIIIIPNWIDCDAYPERTATPAPVTFLFLGWCEWGKGVRELFSAVSILKQQGAQFHLLVAGGGSALPWAQTERVQAGLESCVDVLGWVTGSAKAELFRRAAVLVLPSYSEGLPNAMLEAMASGLAVIATPVGGIPSVLVSEDNGLMVPPRDADGLAVAMARLVGEPTTVLKMGHSNAIKIRSQFSIHRVVPAWAQALRLPVAFGAPKDSGSPSK